MSILKFLTEYYTRRPSRWHTPGHKGDLDPLDITELCDGSFPADLIRQAEQKAAAFYNAKHLRFLTNGSSIGVKAAILAAEGDIIAPEFCHQSVEEGAALAKVRLYGLQRTATAAQRTMTDGFPSLGGVARSDGVVWMADGREDKNISATPPSTLDTPPSTLPPVPTLADVEAAMQAYPSAKAVYLESPDYFGRVIDPAIPDAIRNAGKLFFCDAAHGAHFPACPGLFPPSYAGIADACNLSAHKTLNAYTPGAYLCVNNSALVEKTDAALTLLGTTSPPYLILASLEFAIEGAQNAKQSYERLYQDTQWFRNEIPCLKNDDFTRLVVDAAQFGLSGEALCKKLAGNNVFAETYCGNYAVFIATPHEAREDFEKLAEAIQQIKSNGN